MILKALKIVPLSECKALEFWCCGLRGGGGGDAPVTEVLWGWGGHAKCPSRNRLTRTPVLAEN